MSLVSTCSITTRPWYLSHGMEIPKTYCFVKASSHRAFAPFMEAVSNARREGDVDKSKAMIAEMMKLVGNSAFGRSGMDMSKHKEVKYKSSDIAIKNKIEHFTFHGLEELNDACEITMKKRRYSITRTPSICRLPSTSSPSYACFSSTTTA
ncbi:unnamed protein product [Phytophthora lilii]|uniref:Unnamed protein product n=1 Tax=Phytophthora lilii TaxID=2077276 RepID=A0A9W6XG60_9STRA|nr:unnamed protein product [Phytophthora lilii]